MSKYIRTKTISEFLELTECNDGFWLYDTMRGLLLSMRAQTETAALVEALTYYQRLQTGVTKAQYSPGGRVESFAAQMQSEN